MSAGAEIFKLVGYVAINNIDQAFKDVRKLDKGVSDLADKLGKFAKDVNTFGTFLSKNLTLPLASVGTAIGTLAIKTGQAADHLLDLSQITGLSTDAIQEFEHVARVAGVSSDGFLSVIQKLSNSLPDIAQGTGSAAKALDQLGINVLDVNGNARDMNKLFPEIINGLQRMDNITERNALAQDIFGKSLKDVAPILGMSAAEMQRVRGEAHNLGLVMGGEAINKANDFRISVDKLKAQFAAIGMEIANRFMPILNEQVIPLIQSTVIPAVHLFADAVGSVALAFGKLDGPIQSVILVIIGFVAAAANQARIQSGLAKMNAEEEETRRQALRANLEGRKVEKRLTEYEMAQLKKKQEEEAKAAEDRAKRNAEELRNRKEELSGLLNAHEDAYNKMGKTEMKLLYMGEQAELEKAQRLGATDAQLETVLKHYDAMRQEMIEKDQDYWEEQGREADKYLEERRQTEMKYAADLNEAKRNIAMEGMKRDADDAESALRDVHRAELTEIQKRGGDVKAAQIAHDVEMRTLQVNNAKQIAEAEFDAKKEAMQRQYDAEIEEAEKAFTDTSAIRERYGLEFENLEQQRVAAAKNADAELTEITKEGNAARAALNKQYAQGFVSGMVSAVNQLGSVLSAFSSNEQMRIDRSYKKRKETIEASVTDEEERAKQLAALDAERDAKTLAIQREQATREKALGIFNTVINTAQAIVKALADLGPIAGPVMAGVVGALGVAQTAAIASTPAPFEAGALIQGGRGGVHGLVGEGRQDELILPMDTGVERLAGRLMENMGGESVNNVHYTININAGNIVADDYSAKQFARKINQFIAADNARRGVT